MAVLMAGEEIALSNYTQALIKGLAAVKPKPVPDEASRLEVSQTVSFFALAYEKVRTAVEYRDTHLIRRAAIERILKRRLAMNPQAEGEAENLLRELLWARYFPIESVGEQDVENIQNVLDRYLELRKNLLTGRPEDEKGYLWGFLFDLLTCEIEKVLSPDSAKKQELQTYYVFQVLKDKIRIEGIDETTKNAYFYVALERALAKSDLPYLRFHLFQLTHPLISQMNTDQRRELGTHLMNIAKEIDAVARNSYSDRVLRYVRRQMAPFRILFEFLERKKNDAGSLLSKRGELYAIVEQVCREKYAQTNARLQSLGVRAIIYIFLTKMLFAFILEYPLSLAVFNEVNYVALGINALFPPVLMFLIIGATRVPGEANTKRVFERLIDVIDADNTFETQIGLTIRKPRVRNQARVFAFTVFYSFTFFVTFLLLWVILSILGFNLISQAVFVFFVSLVAFFSFRIRQVASEYKLHEKEGVFAPLLDFFFLPILSLGKFLSSGIARLNFFTFLFDFFIEAPFKLIFEVLEEWIRFVRARKDEIV